LFLDCDAAFGGCGQLGGDALLALARGGVALGVRLPARCAASGDTGRALAGAFAMLERASALDPRLCAYGDARPSAALVDLVREAGVALAFTERPGTNDLRYADRLRLRCSQADAAASPDALSAALASAGALVDRSGPEETRAQRAVRAERVRIRYFYRALDAVLSAIAQPSRSGLEPSNGRAGRRTSNYERMRGVVRSTVESLPGVESGLRRVVMDTAWLPLRFTELPLAGYGSAATVFEVTDPADGRARVLKVYRRTVGRPATALVQLARRHRARQRKLEEWFGDVAMPAHFVVLSGPLRGLPVIACIEDRAKVVLDPLAVTDAELAAFLATRPEASRQFVTFAERVLELRREGSFPDLFGPGNLLFVEESGGLRLRLIDYSVFDLRLVSRKALHEAADAATRRFEGLLALLR
jgi:hypothetical protein